MIVLYIALAHEVGHHIHGHTLNLEDQSGMDDEIEADRFSGVILKYLGITEKDLEDYLNCLNKYSTGDIRKTHPAILIRKKAIREGWRKASEWDSQKIIRKKQIEYDDVSKLKNGFYRVKKNGMYGFLNQIGREVISPQYEEADFFSEDGLARVKKHGWANSEIINKYNQLIKR
jgi:WG containing repeat